MKDIQKNMEHILDAQSELSILFEQIQKTRNTVRARFDSVLKPWNKTPLMKSMHSELETLNKEVELVGVMMHYSKLIEDQNLTSESLYNHIVLANEKDTLYPLTDAHRKIKSALEIMEAALSHDYAALPVLIDRFKHIETMMRLSPVCLAEKRDKDTRDIAIAAQWAASWAQVTANSKR